MARHQYPAYGLDRLKEAEEDRKHTNAIEWLMLRLFYLLAALIAVLFVCIVLYSALGVNIPGMQQLGTFITHLFRHT